MAEKKVVKQQAKRISLSKFERSALVSILRETLTGSDYGTANERAKLLMHAIRQPLWTLVNRLERGIDDE